MRLPLVLALAAAFTCNQAFAAVTDDKPGVGEEHKELKKEAAEHPRIAHSIKALDEAIEDLKKAPHDFGGHREAAIKACEDARKELRAALEVSEAKDDKKQNHEHVEK